MFSTFLSFFLPKFSFILRTCPPSLIEGAIQQFDNALRDAVSGIVDALLSEWAWQKASFPTSLCGKGPIFFEDNIECASRSGSPSLPAKA